MTTARELITKSFRKAKILARGESLSSEEANDGLAELNSMLGMWSNESLLIYGRTLEGFALTANDGEYTIGSGGNFNTTRPLKIVSAYVRNADTDYPLEIVSDEAFANITDKAAQGSIPETLNFNNAFPLATIKLHPLPGASYTLYLLSEKQISSIATLDTVLSLPVGWEDALIYNLAMRLGPEYGQEPDAMTVKMAGDGKAAIKRTIGRNRSFDWGYTPVSSNIYTGFA